MLREKNGKSREKSRDKNDRCSEKNREPNWTDNITSRVSMLYCLSNLVLCSSLCICRSSFSNRERRAERRQTRQQNDSFWHDCSFFSCWFYSWFFVFPWDLFAEWPFRQPCTELGQVTG
jgi:hypothetical protein